MPDQWVPKLSFQYIQRDLFNEKGLLLIKEENSRLPVDVRGSKTSLPKLPIDEIIYWFTIGPCSVRLWPRTYECCSIFKTSVKVFTVLPATWQITNINPKIKVNLCFPLPAQIIILFCQGTFVCSDPRDVKQFCYASLRLSSPKQRVHKINKTCPHNKVKYF